MKNLVCCALFFCQMGWSEELPIPSKEQTQYFKEIVHGLGKEEIMNLSPKVLSQFVWDFSVRGSSEDFTYYSANPLSLSEDQIDLPATILVHGSGSNQGFWLPLIHDIETAGKKLSKKFPVFTFNYNEPNEMQALQATIERVKDLYQKSGTENVLLRLVGHSLGGIVSVEYAFSPDLWIEGTKVDKVIAAASRLRNVKPLTATPFYPYSYDVLERVERCWQSIQKNRAGIELFTVVAEKDWLLPRLSALAGRDNQHSITVKNRGHALICHSHQTRRQIMRWLEMIAE